MVESSTETQYVVRLVRSSENRQMAMIKYHAFNDATNTTPDELSSILATEKDPSTGTTLSMEESVQKTMQTQKDELFKQDASSKYIVVGVYALPPSSSFPSSQDDDDESKDSADLPAQSELVGFSIWQHINPNTPLDHPITDAKESSDPSLTNKFFAQMNRTRESIMKAKSYYFLKLLTIHPSHQRKGLGSKLVKWGTKKADIQNIYAWLESSPMGKGTYLKAGFKVLGFDKVQEKRAKRGYLDWPYMLYEPQNSAP
ncbi:uncharacterized protein UTRI_10366 [Ustilago trichophora]|uniref:N-acetyltransferase domain-containing protein n=1 Tax=Ustilago trichophora TaxID=86804 RepID=A0A5C3EDL2_9BASI|nr:uncharacterized protein UTRI_10366 [Ustilago trichophora]